MHLKKKTLKKVSANCNRKKFEDTKNKSLEKVV